MFFFLCRCCSVAIYIENFIKTWCMLYVLVWCHQQALNKWRWLILMPKILIIIIHQVVVMLSLENNAKTNLTVNIMCLSEGLYFEFPLSMESSYGLLYRIFYFTFALFHDLHETNWWYVYIVLWNKFYWSIRNTYVLLWWCNQTKDIFIEPLNTFII